MANKYLRSTDGADADNGSTWLLGNATMAGLAADMATGDDGFASQDHAESDAGTTAMVITFPGTIASPNRVIFANDAAQPPTSLAATGSLTRTSTGISATLTFAGSFVMVGGTYTVWTSSATAFKFGNADTDVQTYDGSKFIVTNANTAVRMQVGHSATTARNSITFKNCTFKFAGTAQGFSVQRGKMVWDGGGLDAAGSAITSLFPTALASGVTSVLLKNFNASPAASSFDIVGSAFSCTGDITMRRCKLPASWTGGLFTTEPNMPDFRISMYNCDSGDTNYKFLVGDRQGTMRDETTVVMTGGASDESTPISAKVTTTANANETLTPFYTDWMAKRNTAVGTAKTITIEIIHDSVTDLTIADLALEVDVLATSGVPLGSNVSTKRSPLDTSTTALTSSSVTWTTTGLTNPRKQKLTVSATLQEVGYILARLICMKPSYTFWYNVEIGIS